ncbi:MAG: hypothetical protein AAFX51_17500, partial [Cyanobacteria bacterium J06636_28]
MTAQQYPLDNQAQRTNPSQKQGLPIPKLLSAQGSPLGRQLLQTLLPAALLPLVVASGLGFLVTRRSERANALFLLKEESFLASEAASLFIEDNFDDVDELLLNPLVTQALSLAEEKVNTDKLAERPIEQLNQQFSQTKLVTANPVFNQYLSRLTEVEGLGETIITERNGLNVGYSQITSDFVQRDEEWWIVAQREGRSIEPAEFDESSGTFAISLASALTPSGTEDFLGVMRQLVPVDVMNKQIATYVTASISGTQQVQVLDVRST